MTDIDFISFAHQTYDTLLRLSLSPVAAWVIPHILITVIFFSLVPLFAVQPEAFAGKQHQMRVFAVFFRSLSRLQLIT